MKKQEEMVQRQEAMRRKTAEHEAELTVLREQRHKMRAHHGTMVKDMGARLSAKFGERAQDDIDEQVQRAETEHADRMQMIDLAIREVEERLARVRRELGN